MKKNYLLLSLLVICLGLFTSCKDDKDIKETPEIAGTWSLTPVVMEQEQFVSGPINLTWEAPEGTTLMGIDLSFIKALVPSMASPMIAQELKSITFDAKGNISAVINTGEGETVKWEDTGIGYATYTLKPNNVLLLNLNLTKIAAEEPELGAAIQALPELKKLFEAGFTLNYRLSADKKTCNIFIDKAFVQSIMPLMSTIVPLLPEGNIKGILTAVVEQLPGVLKVTTKMEVGLNLVK